MRDKSNFSKLGNFDAQIEKLKKFIIQEGGIFNDRVYPSLSVAYNTAKSGHNALMEKYYKDIHDIDTLYNIVMKDNPNFNEYANSDHPEAVDFLNNMKAALNRMVARNDMALTVKWAKDLDPVSKLVTLIDIGITADNEAWSSDNETLLWLEHNLSYYKKIGFYSQYYPDVLVEALKGYERTEMVELNDKEMQVLAHAIKVYQDMLKPLHGTLNRMSIENTSMEAHEKNNKGAESFIGYGNQKHDDVRDRVIQDTFFLNDVASADKDCIIYTNQHRIQPDGNQLIEYANIHIDDKTGKIVYDKTMLLAAVEQLVAERGYISYYSMDPVESLPELVQYITCEELPWSVEARTGIVESNPGTDYLLRRDSDGEWEYKYKVTMPSVFNLIKDKYPDVESEAESLGVKTRGVFAAMSSASRLGQTFLYPWMDAVRNLILPNNQLYSFMAQWSHPDHLRQMFTDMAFNAHPDLYKNVDLTTRCDKEAVIALHDKLTAQGYYPEQSSDDKTGFDNFNNPLFQWAFASCILAPCFKLSGDDERVLAFLMGGCAFPVVITPLGPTLYSLIIASGQWCTSILGTMSSNFMSLMLKYVWSGVLDDDKVNSYAVTDTEDDETESGFTVADTGVKAKPVADTADDEGDEENEE